MNASDLIDKQIASFPDWRGELLKTLRQLINSAAPGIKEDWKWNTAVWTYNGNVCAIAAFKDHVKVNFFKGPYLDDSDKLFNSGLDAKTTRAIDFNKGDTINGPAFQNLVRAAVALNTT